MIDDFFLINPIAHAYDLSAENVRNRYGDGLRELLWQIHNEWNRPEYQVPRDVFLTDWSMETLTKTLFLESRFDMAANMHLRLDSWFSDGLCSREKNVEAVTRWPDRYLTYVGVDPMAGLETCVNDLVDQMAELPASIGLKLYPDQVEPFRSWRMDDPTLAYPLFEKAQELGIKTVAIHKAVANGPVPLNPYRVDDVDGAAIHFPDLNFEIVHSGLAFVDETAQAIARFPNVYANLEVTTLLLHRAPGWFEEILGAFLFWGGVEKIIYSDGSMLGHSQPLLETFWNLELSDRMLERYGLEQLTKEDKALILGGNYARIVGLDIEAAKRRIAEDEFAVYQREHGLDPPYSNWLALSAEENSEAFTPAS
jgi:uncharacterized protein